MISLKPGGFQEFIDIQFEIDKDEFLRTATLLLDREWVGDEHNLNVFAKDIAKSFIRDTIHTDFQEQVRPIVEILFNVKGEEDHIITLAGETPPSIDEVHVPELRNLVLTFAGIMNSYSIDFSQFQLKMDNIQDDYRKRLRIIILYMP